MIDSPMDKRIERRFWTKGRFLSVTSITVFVLFSIFALTRNGKTYRIDRRMIQTDSVRRGNFHNYISFTALALPEQKVFIEAEEGGRITEIFANSGDYLKAGEPVLSLSNVDLNLTVMSREASLSEQVNNLRNTRLLMEQNSLDIKTRIADLEHSIFVKERQLERHQLLEQKGHLAKNTLEESEEELAWLKNKLDLLERSSVKDSIYRATQIDQLEGSIVRMRQNLDLLRTKLDNLTIKAPIDGQITGLSCEIGQTMAKGQPIAQINDTTSYMLRGTVDERYVTQVTEGLSAKAANDGKTYSARVKKALPDVSGGTFPVEISFTDTIPAGIASGQSYRVDIKLGESREALLLPRGSFFSHSGGKFVFVMDESGNTAWRRDIEIGLQNREFYEVLSGLQEGEIVVTSSYAKYKDMDRIVIKG